MGKTQKCYTDLILDFRLGISEICNLKSKI